MMLRSGIGSYALTKFSRSSCGRVACRWLSSAPDEDPEVWADMEEIERIFSEKQRKNEENLSKMFKDSSSQKWVPTSIFRDDFSDFQDKLKQQSVDMGKPKLDEDVASQLELSKVRSEPIRIRERGRILERDFSRIGILNEFEKQIVEDEPPEEKGVYEGIEMYENSRAVKHSISKIRRNRWIENEMSENGKVLLQELREANHLLDVMNALIRIKRVDSVSLTKLSAMEIQSVLQCIRVLPLGIDEETFWKEGEPYLDNIFGVVDGRLLRDPVTTFKKEKVLKMLSDAKRAKILGEPFDVAKNWNMYKYAHYFDRDWLLDNYFTFILKDIPNTCLSDFRPIRPDVKFMLARSLGELQDIVALDAMTFFKLLAEDIQSRGYLFSREHLLDLIGFMSKEIAVYGKPRFRFDELIYRAACKYAATAFSLVHPKTLCNFVETLVEMKQLPSKFLIQIADYLIVNSGTLHGVWLTRLAYLVLTSDPFFEERRAKQLIDIVIAEFRLRSQQWGLSETIELLNICQKFNADVPEIWEHFEKSLNAALLAHFSERAVLPDHPDMPLPLSLMLKSGYLEKEFPLLSEDAYIRCDAKEFGRMWLDDMFVNDIKDNLPNSSAWLSNPRKKSFGMMNSIEKSSLTLPVPTEGRFQNWAEHEESRSEFAYDPYLVQLHNSSKDDELIEDSDMSESSLPEVSNLKDKDSLWDYLKSSTANPVPLIQKQRENASAIFDFNRKSGVLSVVRLSPISPPKKATNVSKVNPMDSLHFLESIAEKLVPLQGWQGSPVFQTVLERLVPYFSLNMERLSLDKLKFVYELYDRQFGLHHFLCRKISAWMSKYCLVDMMKLYNSPLDCMDTESTNSIIENSLERDNFMMYVDEFSSVSLKDVEAIISVLAKVHQNENILESVQIDDETALFLSKAVAEECVNPQTYSEVLNIIAQHYKLNHGDSSDPLDALDELDPTKVSFDDFLEASDAANAASNIRLSFMDYLVNLSHRLESVMDYSTVDLKVLAMAALAVSRSANIMNTSTDILSDQYNRILGQLHFRSSLKMTNMAFYVDLIDAFKFICELDPSSKVMEIRSDVLKNLVSISWDSQIIPPRSLFAMLADILSSPRITSQLSLEQYNLISDILRSRATRVSELDNHEFPVFIKALSLYEQLSGHSALLPSDYRAISQNISSRVYSLNSKQLTEILSEFSQLHADGNDFLDNLSECIRDSAFTERFCAKEMGILFSSIVELSSPSKEVLCRGIISLRQRFRDSTQKELGMIDSSTWARIAKASGTALVNILSKSSDFEDAEISMPESLVSAVEEIGWHALTQLNTHGNLSPSDLANFGLWVKSMEHAGSQFPDKVPKSVIDQWSYSPSPDSSLPSTSAIDELKQALEGSGQQVLLGHYCPDSGSIVDIAIIDPSGKRTALMVNKSSKADSALKSDPWYPAERRAIDSILKSKGWNVVRVSEWTISSDSASVLSSVIHS